MRTYIVCVDYADILALTLPYNRHHFDEVAIVTAPRDKATAEVAKANHASVFVTDAFYRDGAMFNKWRALEEAMDAHGRDGLLCIMDADICWPKEAKVKVALGQLFSPFRRMAPWNGEIPAEAMWARYGRHRNVGEWAGYTQLFYGEDPILPQPPWHDTSWRHAGGADSFFQQRWAPENKVRPTWECLHVGNAGENWCGVTAEGRRELAAIFRRRRETPGFVGEKILPPPG